MKKRFCAFGALTLLLAALLWLFLFRAPQPPHLGQTLQEDAEDYTRAIVYVPLDDRPDNLERLVYLARSLGYTVLLPDSDLYATRLDGQARTAGGTGHGDRGALLQWVAEMDALGCDIFLLSCDQLLSGGLVNSRAMTATEDVTFPDGSTLTEDEAIARYLLPLGEDQANRVYLFDSVMRLASTVEYGGFGLEDYHAIRSYGMVPRPLLTGEELTYENIIAAYGTAAGGGSAADAVEDAAERARLTEDVLARYHAARARKLHLLDYLLSACADFDNFHFMIGVDDSSSAHNIQTNELAYIQSLLDRRGKGDLLLNGVDDLAMMLVTRMAQDKYQHPIAVYVEFFGGREDLPATPYDHQSFRDTITVHLDALSGYEVASPQQADIQILALTAPADSALTTQYVESLIARLQENEAAQIPTIFIDVSDNFIYALYDKLFAGASFSRLLGYAGYCDLAIAAGASISQGFARYLYLTCCEEKSPACDEAFLQSLTEACMLSISYKTDTKPQLNAYIRNRLQLNPDNIQGTPGQTALLRRKVDELLIENCRPLCENLSGGAIITSLAPYAEQEVEEVRISGCYLPWNRTFEASCTIDVTLAG